MSLDTPQPPREEMEARLTALLLGELSPEEGATLQRAIEQDAELARLHERLKQTVRLVREAAVSPTEPANVQTAPLKLSPERRQKLLAQFKTVAPKEFTPPRQRKTSWFVPMSAAAALVVFAGLTLLWTGREYRIESLPALHVVPSLLVETALSGEGKLESGRSFGYAEQNDSKNLPLSADAEMLLARQPDADSDFSYKPENGRQKALGSGDAKGAKPATAAKPQSLARNYSIVLPSGGPMPDVVAPGTFVAGINTDGAPKDNVWNRVDDLFSGDLAQRGVGGQAGVSLAGGSQRAWFDQGGFGSGSGRARGGAEPHRLDFDGVSDMAGRGPAEGPARSQESLRELASDSSALTPPPPAPTLDFGVKDELGNAQAIGLLTDRGRAGKEDDVLPLESINFQNADLGKVLDTYQELSGRTVLRPASLPEQKITITNQTALTRKEAVQALDSVLSLNQITIVPQGERFAKALPTGEAEIAAREYRPFNEKRQLGEPLLSPDLTSKDVGGAVQQTTLENEPSAMGILGTNFIAEVPKQAGTGGVYSVSAVGYYSVAELKNAVTVAAKETAASASGDTDKKAGPVDTLAVVPDDVPVRTAKPLEPAAVAAARPTTEPETLRRLEALRIEAQAEHEKTTDLYNRLTGLGRSELKKALATASPDPQLAELLPQLSDSESKLAQLEQGFGPVPPGLAQARKHLEQINQKINDRLDGVLEGLEAKRASSKAKLDSLQAEVDKAKKADVEQALKRRPYFEAKRDLESLEIVRDRLSQRISQEKVDTSIPKLGIVKIVEQAEAQPASSPTLGERIKGAFAGGVERSARIAVEKGAGVVAGLDSSQRARSGFDPYWLQTEFETLQSKPVLEKVIEKLNLNEAWAEELGSGERLNTEETLRRLKKRLSVSQGRNSNVIDIRVKSEEPEEAARIANTIAEVYRDQRLEEQVEISRLGIRTLQEELAKQNESIASAQRELKRLQPEGDRTHADPTPAKSATPPPVPQPEVQTRDNAFSTFSLNVSDVSFKLAAASLEKGQMPEPATVRSEEFINAFDYRDPEPSPGAPIGFAWERARYPFAHNRDLLRFSVKTAAAGRQPGRPLNLVLLLDNSGSMERADRVRIIHEALRVLARQFQPQDKISLIAFARTARLWMDGVSGSQAGEVAEKASSLTPQGGTNLEDALNLAYQTAQRHYLAHGINRVALLTDGAANLGNVQPETLKQKVEAHRKQGIALDCFGVGWEGFNDDLLETLSRNGDGRYGFINTPDDAATEFAGQLAGALKVAASDVKVQVEFNPERVTAYRQIGYAKHQLTKEQFRDNTVDAAEIGAAESGNALYVVETNPRGKGPLATVRVRFKVPGTADYREHDWDVPCNGSAMTLEQASVPMRLAATASAFSEWLVSSPYAAEVTPDRLLGYLGGVAEACGVDERPKKLEWMIRQAKSLYGK